MIEDALVLYPARALRSESYRSEYICPETFERILDLEYTSDSIVSWDWDSDDPVPEWEDDFQSVAIGRGHGNFREGTLTETWI